MRYAEVSFNLGSFESSTIGSLTICILLWDYQCGHRNQVVLPKPPHTVRNNSLHVYALSYCWYYSFADYNIIANTIISAFDIRIDCLQTLVSMHCLDHQRINPAIKTDKRITTVDLS